MSPLAGLFLTMGWEEETSHNGSRSSSAPRHLLGLGLALALPHPQAHRLETLTNALTVTLHGNWTAHISIFPTSSGCPWNLIGFHDQSASFKLWWKQETTSFPLKASQKTTKVTSSLFASKEICLCCSSWIFITIQIQISIAPRGQIKFFWIWITTRWIRFHIKKKNKKHH